MLIYFGIGTNLGNREENLRTAVQFLHERVGECLACSSIYRSAPQGFVSENEFANIVAVCETNYSPEETLVITQQIECDMGRKQKSMDGVYHDRIIDIDLLLVQNAEVFVVLKTDTLTIPHPRMQERDFVQIPLHEIETILHNSIPY